MRRPYLYLCDRKRRIADGKCNGWGCIGDQEEDYVCRHTTDLEYAKYQKDFDDRVFEIIPTSDEYGNPMLSYWELEPEEMH